MLQQNERDFLDGLGITNPTWKMSERFEDQLKTFLLVQCAFPDLLNMPDKALIINAMAFNVTGVQDNDPIPTISNIVNQCYINDDISSGSIMTYRRKVYDLDNLYFVQDNKLYIQNNSQNPYLIATVDNGHFGGGQIIDVIQKTADGTVYISGDFTTVNGISGFNGVAAMIMTNWSPAGEPAFTLDNLSGGITSSPSNLANAGKLHFVHNTVLVSVGNSAIPSGDLTYNVMKYTGTSWVNLKAVDIQRPITAVVGSQQTYPKIYISCSNHVYNDTNTTMLYYKTNITDNVDMERLEFPSINRLDATGNDIRGTNINDMTISANKIIIVGNNFDGPTQSTSLIVFDGNTFAIDAVPFTANGSITQVVADRYGNAWICGNFREITFTPIANSPVTLTDLNGITKLLNTFNGFSADVGLDKIGDINFYNTNQNYLESYFLNGCVNDIKLSAIDDGENIIAYADHFNKVGTKPYFDGNYVYCHSSISIAGLAFINTTDLIPHSLNNRKDLQNFTKIGRFNYNIND